MYIEDGRLAWHPCYRINLGSSRTDGVEKKEIKRQMMQDIRDKDRIR